MYKCQLLHPKDDKPVQSQRVVIDRAESSRARCRDDEDNDDGDDDDINDPTYDQDELTGSAPQGTQTQVRVSLPSST